MERVLVIITGSSRGLGWAFATAILRDFTSQKIKCDFILNSTKLVELEKVKESLVKLEGGSGASVKLFACDWADRTSMEVDPTVVYDLVVFVNNHGTLGPLVSVDSLETRTAEIFKHIDINTTSSLVLTSQTLHYFDSTRAKKLRLVNISSLAAIKPFETWSLYCVAKAGRDMLQAVIAAENPGPRVKSLSYAPGACDTDMQTQIRTTGTSATQNKLVQPDSTAAVLTKLLLQDKYDSGSHIDYWDVQGS